MNRVSRPRRKERKSVPDAVACSEQKKGRNDGRQKMHEYVMVRIKKLLLWILVSVGSHHNCQEQLRIHRLS